MIGMNNSQQTNVLDVIHETRNSISQPFPPQTEIVRSPPAQNLWIYKHRRYPAAPLGATRLLRGRFPMFCAYSDACLCLQLTVAPL